MKRTVMECGEGAAKKGPGGREPAEEHPVGEGAKEAGSEESARPGVAGEEPAEGEGSADAGRINRNIIRDEYCVVGFQMPPIGMGRIGKAAGVEGVGEQEVAELVVDSGLRRREPRQEEEAQEDGGEGKDGKAKAGTGGELTDCGDALLDRAAAKPIGIPGKEKAECDDECL